MSAEPELPEVCQFCYKPSSLFQPLQLVSFDKLANLPRLKNELEGKGQQRKKEDPVTPGLAKLCNRCFVEFDLLENFGEGMEALKRMVEEKINSLEEIREQAKAKKTSGQGSNPDVEALFKTTKKTATAKKRSVKELDQVDQKYLKIVKGSVQEGTGEQKVSELTKAKSGKKKGRPSSGTDQQPPPALKKVTVKKSRQIGQKKPAEEPRKIPGQVGTSRSSVNQETPVVFLGSVTRVPEEEQRSLGNPEVFSAEKLVKDKEEMEVDQDPLVNKDHEVGSVSGNLTTIGGVGSSSSGNEAYSLEASTASTQLPIRSPGIQHSSVSSSSTSGLSSGNIIMSVGGKEKVLCPTCGKSVAGEYLLKHLRVHTGEMPVKCHFCGMKFRFTSCRYQHIKLCHQEEFAKRRKYKKNAV